MDYKSIYYNIEKEFPDVKFFSYDERRFIGPWKIKYSVLMAGYIIGNGTWHITRQAYEQHILESIIRYYNIMLMVHV